MSSRNVAIRKDVYDALSREKRPRESFTRLFERLMAQRGPLEELGGAWGRAPSSNELRLLEEWRRVGSAVQRRPR